MPTVTPPPTTRPPTTRPTSPTTKPSTSTAVPAPVVTSVTLSPTAVDDVAGCDAGAVMGITAKVTGSASSVAFTWVAGTTSGAGTLTSAGAGMWTGSINFGALSQPADVGPVTVTVTARNATGNGTRQAAGTILNCKP